MGQSPYFVAENGSGSLVPLLVGKQGSALISQRHLVNYEAAYAGDLGFVQNSAPVTTSVALATTYVGLCLSNPIGSPVNLALLSVSAAFQVAPSTITTVSLATGFSAAGIVTHTTALVPQSTLVGSGNTLSGLADSACTLVGTPVYSGLLAQAPTATTSFLTTLTLNGALMLAPGSYVAIVTNIAGPASGFVGSMMWEEQPL